MEKTITISSIIRRPRRKIRASSYRKIVSVDVLYIFIYRRLQESDKSNAIIIIFDLFNVIFGNENRLCLEPIRLLFQNTVLMIAIM